MKVTTKEAYHKKYGVVLLSNKKTVPNSSCIIIVNGKEQKARKDNVLTFKTQIAKYLGLHTPNRFYRVCTDYGLESAIKWAHDYIQRRNAPCIICGAKTKNQICGDPACKIALNNKRMLGDILPDQRRISFKKKTNKKVVLEKPTDCNLCQRNMICFSRKIGEKKFFNKNLKVNNKLKRKCFSVREN